jgi:hypothetical protein
MGRNILPSYGKIICIDSKTADKAMPFLQSEYAGSSVLLKVVKMYL